MNRRGFTITESAIVVVVLATVARLAVPLYEVGGPAAEAEIILERVRAVEHAARAHRDGTGGWPVDGEPGEVPESLRDRLPEGFSSEGEGYTLDWEHWPLPDGVPERPDVRRLLGVTVRTDDPRVGNAYFDRAGREGTVLVLGNGYTLLFPE